ncbi:MFS transporter [Paenibacillus sp. Marseille-Q4541]|uniref:MFS transporter n=1 Tax=Paenibacillus sp. Marseille-Q4541 TaxID=2831522 RepID=UPI001BAC28FC|nr:MFS transporter [Paenibacillus sp. Marseille-Q4541]
MRTFSFDRNFNLMIVGQIITLFGSSILRFALSLYILDLTGSAETFALLLAISTIPTVILSPIGGAIADRVNRRNLMVIFDFLSCAVVGGLALILYNGNPSIPVIGVVMTLLGVVSTFYQPTVQASIPILVEESKLLKANGIVSGVSAITNFAGPVLGGVLYSLSGIDSIVIMTCLSFFLAAVTEMFIRMPFVKETQTYGALKTILLDLKEGGSYIFKRDSFLMKFIVIAASMNVFITPLFLVGIPYIIKIIMGMNDQFFGFTQGGISLSMIFAAIAVGLISSKLRINNLYLWFVGSGVLFIPMSFSIYPLFLGMNNVNYIQYIIFSLCAMLIMFVITIINIFIMTTLQQQTPNLMLGKVMAILTAVSTCAVPVGQILFGALIDRFSTNVYALILVISLITIGIGFGTKKLLRDPVKAPEEVNNALS